MIRVLCLAALLALGACKTTELQDGGYAPGFRPVSTLTLIQPFIGIP